jgi:hypothetical protein
MQAKGAGMSALVSHPRALEADLSSSVSLPLPKPPPLSKQNFEEAATFSDRLGQDSSTDICQLLTRGNGREGVFREGDGEPGGVITSNFLQI